MHHNFGPPGPPLGGQYREGMGHPSQFQKHSVKNYTDENANEYPGHQGIMVQRGQWGGFPRGGQFRGQRGSNPQHQPHMGGGRGQYNQDFYGGGRGNY